MDASIKGGQAFEVLYRGEDTDQNSNPRVFGDARETIGSDGDSPVLKWARGRMAAGIS